MMLLSRLKSYAIIVGAAIAAFFVAYAKGRSDATARNERRILESEVESRQEAAAVRRDVDGASDIDSRLQHWTRTGG